MGSDFAINPIGISGDYQGMVISSRAGRLFRISNISLSAGVAGLVWQPIANPNVLDGTYAPALAFGSPPAGVVNVDNFIYAGTLGGHISSLPSRAAAPTGPIFPPVLPTAVPIVSISADPTRGSRKVLAITQQAVYYLADSGVAVPTWVRISDTPGKGYIFPNAAAGQTGVVRPVWNNLSDMVPAFNAATGLTSMAVDWRFAIPDNPGNPTGPSHPVLYVGGDGGVVTSTDLGNTWTIFPALSAANSATQTGGYLPEVRVTDLKLILGDINPVTGIPDTSTGLNMLVASTYGRGDFAIRINDSAYQSQIVIPNSGPKVASIAAFTSPFGQSLAGITVTFTGPVDPLTFTPNSVDYVLGPNGAQIPVQYVQDVTPNPIAGTGNPHNVYRILFATPANRQWVLHFAPRSEYRGL